MEHLEAPLEKAERGLAEFSAKVYMNSLYRYGHFCGWLVPLTVIFFFAPDFKPYKDHLCICVLLLLILSQHFITTRVIGKLYVASLGKSHLTTDTLSVAKSFRKRGYRTLAIYLVLLPISTLMTLSPTKLIPISRERIAAILGAECFLGGSIAVIGIFGSPIVLLTGNRVRSIKWMEVGIDMVLGLGIVGLLAALIISVAK